MESFPKFKERGQEGLEMLQGLKKSFVHLCEQMKKNLELGYDALVSDDTGGRIPTLIFREICRQVHNNPDLKTLFVASGIHYKPKTSEENKQLDDYLKKGIGESARVLLVTQHIQLGNTINHLIEHLQTAGAYLVDVATIDNYQGELSNTSNPGSLYVGGILDKRQLEFTENNNILSGISKKRKYDPRPMRLDTAIETGEQNRSTYISTDEYNKLAEIESHDGFYEQRKKREDMLNKLPELDRTPLSGEEKKQIQDNINNTRSMIKQIASEVVEEVWGKNQS